MRISDWSSDVCSSDLRSLDHTRIERRLAADDGGVELVPVLYSENRPGVDGGVLQQEKPSRPLGAVQRRAVHRARVMEGDHAGMSGEGNRLREFDAAGNRIDAAAIDPVDMVETGRASCRERVCQYV